MDKTVRIKVEPKPIYARVLVPTYVIPSDWIEKWGEYSPWVIGHINPKQLTNEVLDDLYHQWAEQNPDDDFSNFVENLEEDGYIVYHVDNGGVWHPE